MCCTKKKLDDAYHFIPHTSYRIDHLCSTIQDIFRKHEVSLTKERLITTNHPVRALVVFYKTSIALTFYCFFLRSIRSCAFAMRVPNSQIGFWLGHIVRRGNIQVIESCWMLPLSIETHYECAPSELTALIFFDIFTKNVWISYLTNSMRAGYFLLPIRSQASDRAHL